jgi:hypothetical protein
MKEYKQFERQGRKLWYEKNFREWLKENKHLPDNIENLVRSIQKKGETAHADDIEIECIDVNEEDGALYSKSFKVTVGDQKFFLKLENESIAEEGGFQEMESTLLAKDEIEAVKTQGVKVIEPLWGYEDQKENKSYYVAEWSDLPTLDEILTEYEKQNSKKAAELLKRIYAIQKILQGYREISPANMFYDKENDEIILFDLHV